MKDNFYNEFKSLLGHSQDIVDKYSITMSYKGGYMPQEYHEGWVLLCQEDAQKVHAMIKLLDEFEEELKVLQKDEKKRKGYDNPIDYYYPCGGGTLF